MSTTLTRGHRRIVGVLAALSSALALVPAAQAQAAAGRTSAACTARFTATITPGFSMTTSSGTFTTHGQTGSFTCLGRIGGHRVTGPGSIGVEETYTGACASHVGTGTVRIIVPTTAGTKDMVGALTVRRTALVVLPQVQFSGARFGGIGLSVPAQGNCFVTPLRRVLLLVAGAMSG
ncbi:MAG: hypothetical protein ACRDLN_01020 [Solirubrobacteraceae bacterium]